MDYTFSVVGITITLTEGEAVVFQEEGTSDDDANLREMIAYSVMASVPTDIDVTSVLAYLQTTGHVKLYLDSGRLQEVDPSHAYSLDILSPNQLPMTVYAVADDVGLCQIKSDIRFFGKMAGPPTVVEFQSAKAIASLDDLAGKQLQKGLQDGFKSGFDKVFKGAFDDLDFEIAAANALQDFLTAQDLTAVKAELKQLLETVSRGYGDLAYEKFDEKISFLGRSSNYISQEIAATYGRGAALLVNNEAPQVGYRLVYDVTFDMKKPHQQILDKLRDPEFRRKLRERDFGDLSLSDIDLGEAAVKFTLLEGAAQISELKLFTRANSNANLLEDIGNGNFRFNKNMIYGMSLHARTPSFGLDASFEQENKQNFWFLRGDFRW